jgi:hypothetical protein
MTLQDACSHPRSCYVLMLGQDNFEPGSIPEIYNHNAKLDGPRMHAEITINCLPIHILWAPHAKRQFALLT